MAYILYGQIFYGWLSKLIIILNDYWIDILKAICLK